MLFVLLPVVISQKYHCKKIEKPVVEGKQSNILSMKIIQTFWTTDKNKNPFDNNGGFLSPVAHWMMWGLSCAKFKEFYKNVTLYTDELGKQVFEALGLPYTKIIVSHEDGFMQSVDPKLWAFAKIYTYSLQNEPFLHVDGDVVVWDKLPRKIEQAQLATQCLEYNWPIYKECVNDFKKITKQEMPEWLQWGTASPSGYNMGIFGGKDIDFIQSYCKHAIDFYINYNAELSSLIKINRNTNVLPEQYLLYAMASKYGKNVSMLSEKPMITPLELSEYTNIFEIPDKTKIFHAIGGVKKSSLANDFVSFVLKNEYPDLWDRITSVCNEELKQGKFYYFGLGKTGTDYEYVEYEQATKTLREIAEHSKFDCTVALKDYSDLVNKQKEHRKKYGRSILSKMPFPSYSTKGIDLSKWKYRNKFIIITPNVEVFKTNYEWRRIFMETSFGEHGPVPYLMGDVNYRNIYTGSWNHFWVDDFMWGVIEDLKSKPYTVKQFVNKYADDRQTKRLVYLLLTVWYKNGLLTVNEKADDFVRSISADYEFLQSNRECQVNTVVSYILQKKDIFVSAEEINVKHGDDGAVSLQSLIDCMGTYGLQVKGVKAEIGSLSTLSLPAIALVRFRQVVSQYAVISSVSDGFITVFNAETMMEEQYPHEEFIKIWDGVMIIER